MPQGDLAVLTLGAAVAGATSSASIGPCAALTRGLSALGVDGGALCLCWCSAGRSTWSKGRLAVGGAAYLQVTFLRYLLPATPMHGSVLFRRSPFGVLFPRGSGAGVERRDA